MGLPTKTKWEDELYAQVIIARLPKPERNYRGAIPGRKFECDLFWPQHRVAVEVQGGIWSRGPSGHTSGRGIIRDTTKICLAQLEGIVILPVTENQIRSGKALAWISKAIAQRGDL